MLKKGFSLTEILIVISILIFLTLLILAMTRGQLFKGNDARRKGEIHRIKVAVEEYEKDHDCYPLPQLVSCQPGNGLLPYLEKIPCEPTTGASYFYEHEDSLCPKWYRLYASLNNLHDQAIANLGCQNGCGPNLAFNFYSAAANAPDPATGGGSSPSDFYGCQGGGCVPIAWDPARPGPECDPNYQSPSCYLQCGKPGTECQPWK